MALRHMIQTWTSSFLQTSREFFRVRRLGKVFDLVTRVELQRKRFKVRKRDFIWWVYLFSFWYLMECRAARGTEEDGEGRLQSPWRSSMERLQGESMDETSPPDSDCSPSNLNSETKTCYCFESFHLVFSCIHEEICCQQMKHQLLHLNPNPNHSDFVLIEHVVLINNI